MTLRNVKVGQTVQVTRLNGEGALRRRIMDMGITKGTALYVRKVAPWGTRWRSPSADMSCPSARATPNVSKCSEDIIRAGDRPCLLPLS